MTDNSFTSEDGFEVTSSSETAAEIKEALGTPAKEAAEAPEKPAEQPKPEPQADGAGDEEESAHEAAKPAEEKKADHKGKPKYDPTARVMQATRQAAEAKKERDEIQRRFEEAQQELERLRSGKAPEQAKKAAPEGKPTPDAFETYEEYTEALTDWKIEQREQAREAARREEAFAKTVKERVNSFQERIGQHLQAHPDFWDKVSPDVVSLRPLSTLAPDEPKGALNALAEHFITSEHGPALMMYFTDHPDEIQRFSALHPITFGVELGKIEVGLGAASTATVPKPSASKARPPVRPVTGSPTTDPDEIDDDAPFEAFVKHRNAQERAARSGR